MEAINLISLLLIILFFVYIFANILGELQKLKNS
jgi:hypothetical protein